jgi:zinc protease
VSPTLGRGLSPARTVLDNGAVVLVQETTTAPAVAVNATFRAGNLHDPADLPGLSYLTGRVIDRGTERRSAEVIAEELDERGVALSVSGTRHTMTLSCTCLAEDFGDVLAIVMDVARRPAFPELDIEKRKAEAITAIRQDEDNPAVRAVETFFALLYGEEHPYGRRAKGTVASIERIERPAIAAFHAAHVQPASLSLAVVGDVATDDVQARAAREMKDWRGAAVPASGVPPPPAAAGRRRRVVEMPGKSQTDVAYGFATIGRLDPRYYAYWMMNNILGQFGLGGRLAENIRERQGMAYYAFSVFDPNVGPGPLMVRAGVDPRNVERAIEAIDFEVGRLGREGPTPAEVEESRASLIGSIPRMFETNHSIAAFLQTAELFGLGLDYDHRLPGLLEAVTAEEVAAAAAEALVPELATFAFAGPHQA